MKRFIFIVIILILHFYYVPKYVELNDLKVIDKISIIEKDERYIVTLREVIPKKENNGIIYKYKYYRYNVTNLDDIKSLENKRFYFKKVKSLNTNIDSNFIKNYFRIRLKVIT